MEGINKSLGYLVLLTNLICKYLNIYTVCTTTFVGSRSFLTKNFNEYYYIF